MRLPVFKVCIIFTVLWFSGNQSMAQDKLSLWLIGVQTSPSFKLLSAPVKVDSVGLKAENLVFLEKDNFLFYVREGHDGDDIYALNYSTRANTLLAHSSEPISSLRLMPDGKFLSCLLTTSEGKKNLVKFPLKGGNAIPVMDSLAADNYIWIDDNSVLAIMPETPNSLVMFGFRPRRETPVVIKVGHTLAAASQSKTLAFIHKISVDIWAVKGVHTDGKIKIITEILPEHEVFTMSGDGKVILYADHTLQVFHPQRKSWQTIELPPSIGEVKAIQVNPQGDYIAILAGDQSSK